VKAGYVIGLCLSVTIVAPGWARDDTFTLKATTVQPYTRTYLGNGYFSLVSSQWETKPAQSFMI